MSTIHSTFATAIDRAQSSIRDYSRLVKTEKWQGIDISKKPEAEMRELIHWDFKVPMTDKNVSYYAAQIKPNLPWADEHFEERICGYPMNPGRSWLTWPYANSAKNFLDKDGRFEVSYMERFWAGQPFDDTPEPDLTSLLRGIRGRKYGDLNSIIELLTKEPLTRQAYLPIYFPEDTGAGGRIMCSLGYHWLMRGGFLHVFYPIRSCDFYRHFRDDMSLCVRLTLWLMDRLAERNPDAWKNVQPGYFSMWIGSLHVFVNDYNKLFGTG